MRDGLLAEFETSDQLLAAIRELRERGLGRLDAFVPYPIPGLDEALGLSRSRIPAYALVAGAVGAATAYFVQYFTSSVDYPLNVGGRPPHTPLMFVPITFELTVLFAALAAFLAVFLLSGLPRLWHPVFEVDGFERATIDRFWLGVDSRDPQFEDANGTSLLRELGALRVTLVRHGP